MSRGPGSGKIVALMRLTHLRQCRRSVSLALSAAILAIAALGAMSRPAAAQCTKTQCGLFVVRPTCAMLPTEGLDSSEKPRVAYNCTCCVMTGNQENCTPDDKIVPTLTLYSGNTKVAGAFKPAGERCRLMPALDFERTLGPGTYTIKGGANQGMVTFTVVGNSSDGGCAVAPSRSDRWRGMGLAGFLGAAGLFFVRRRRRS